MIGAKSRDAPRRARPKAALNLVRIANGMDSYCSQIALKIFFSLKCHFHPGQADDKGIPIKHRSLSAFYKANANQWIVQIESRIAEFTLHRVSFLV
jgi:hypothetical protein